MSYKSETGRSMVEIMAVLAIIGVLSVSGVVGYRYAMNKNKANNVAEEVSILAHEVSQQMMRGHTPEDVVDQVKNLKDVDINVVKYKPAQKKYDPNTPLDPDDDQFVLDVTGLKPDVCKIFVGAVLGAEPGLQRIQKNDEGNIQDITSSQDCNDTADTQIGLVFTKDLTDICPAGEYKKDGVCQEAEDGYITSGDGNVEKCPNGQTSNSEHTECVACSSSDTCGCEKKANGKGGCADCVKNADCGSGKMCVDSGQCYACPTNGKCTQEKGFTCNDGYKIDGVLCCPNNATCTTNVMSGKMEVACSSGYTLSNGGQSCSACKTDGSATCSSCHSAIPYWTTAEECVSNPCPANSSLSVTNGKRLGTTGCYCDPGYFPKNNTCIVGTGCFDNKDCNNGKIKGEKYCNFDNGNLTYSIDGGIVTVISENPGTCTNATSVSGAKTNLLRSSYPLWWWSANNFCLAHGKELFDVSKLGCYSGTTAFSYTDPYSKGSCYSSGTTEFSLKMKDIRSDFGGYSLWTGKIVPSASSPYRVFSDGTVDYTKNRDSSTSFYALCE